MTLISWLWCACGIALSSTVKLISLRYTNYKRVYVKSGLYTKKKKKRGLYKKTIKRLEE